MLRLVSFFFISTTLTIMWVMLVCGAWGSVLLNKSRVDLEKENPKFMRLMILMFQIWVPGMVLLVIFFKYWILPVIVLHVVIWITILNYNDAQKTSTIYRYCHKLLSKLLIYILPIISLITIIVWSIRVIFLL